MKVSVTTDYMVSVETVFDLPEGKTWDDVQDWFVKYDFLFITMKDGEKLEVRLDEATWDHVDFKRPDNVTFRSVAEGRNYADYSTPALAEE